MTDYWVSNKKHYCEVCRCWVTGHSQNITRHESSLRHVYSLKNKMIETHKRRSRKKKQAKFEEEEMKRLNSITLENPVPSESNSNFQYVNDLFSYRPLLQPTLDFEAEKKRIANSINRSLSAYEQPEHVDLNYNSTRWVATIDQDDGSLVYYNKFTGIRTKNRPKDFDGVLPSPSAHLASNWLLKFDPMKGQRYYHNLDTGEVRWLDPAPATEVILPQSPYCPPNDLISPPLHHDDTSYIQYNLKHDSLHESQTIQLKLSQSVKHEDIEGVDHHLYANDINSNGTNNGLHNTCSPVIGQWEVVSPGDSVFTHWVENTDILLTPDQTTPLNDPVVDEQFQLEQANCQAIDEDKGILKPTYKRNSEESLYDKPSEVEEKDTRAERALVFNKRRVRKRIH